VQVSSGVFAAADEPPQVTVLPLMTAVVISPLEPEVAVAGAEMELATGPEAVVLNA
jgi:hypothetical protein